MEDVTDLPAVRSRQAELVDSAIFEQKVVIIGAGAIGSFTALTLAKMGFKDITVYDDDVVSVENISNQFYRYEDIDRMKVTALSDMIWDFERIVIKARPNKWTPEQKDELEGYVIMAVDSMHARKHIYNAIQRNQYVYGFIDGRMGGQQAELYSIDLTKQEQRKIYPAYLWNESETSELRCTQKAVMYNVLWIASMIANNLRLMLENKPFRNVMLMDFENVNHINVLT
jgi:molybdopterin/thiamine biosynthesis adenylyltransferase